MCRAHRWLAAGFAAAVLTPGCSATLIKSDPYLRFTANCLRQFEGVVPTPGLTCATLEVPIDWNAPEGDTMDVVVFRVEPSSAPIQGEIWILDGGPGKSGVSFLDHVLVRHLRDEGWRVYIPSHRGALLPRLDCGEHPAARPACLEELRTQWGDDLRHFTTEHAAHDLHAVMDAIPRIESSPVVMFGVSYGAYWADHYIAHHPGELDALILDSPLPGNVDVFSLLDQQQATFATLVASCTDDPICAAKAGYDDADAMIAAMKAAVDERDCGERDGGTWADSSFARTLGDLVNQGSSRDFVPFLVALIADCDGETGELFEEVAQHLLGNERSRSGSASESRAVWGPSSNSRSEPLGLIVLHNSIIPADVDVDEEVAERDDAVSLGMIGRFRDARRTYGELPIVEQPAKFDHKLPVLVLTGRYDLQTPLGTVEEIADRFQGPVEMQVLALADHFVTDGGDLDDVTCPLAVVPEFAAQPGIARSIDCDHGHLDPTLERQDLAWRAGAIIPGVEDLWSLVTND